MVEGVTLAASADEDTTPPQPANEVPIRVARARKAITELGS